MHVRYDQDDDEQVVEYMESGAAWGIGIGVTVLVLILVWYFFIKEDNFKEAYPSAGLGTRILGKTALWAVTIGNPEWRKQEYDHLKRQAELRKIATMWNEARAEAERNSRSAR